MKFLLFITLAVLLLTGCEENKPVELYLYGPTKSCLAKNLIATKCKSVNVYDKVNLSVNNQSQEVTFVREAIGLDASNIVFKKLENCKVVDVNNFSCDGLSRSSSVFLEKQEFGNLLVSRSKLLYFMAEKFDFTIEVVAIEFLDEHEVMANLVMIFGAIFILIGINS